LKLGLNGSTTDQCHLLEDIDVAKAAGFDLLELRTYKIAQYLKDGGNLEDLRQAFNAKNVAHYAINALEFFTLKKDEKEKNEMLKEAEYWCQVAQNIGCPYLVAVPARHNKESEAEIRKDAVKSLKQVGAIAEKYDVKIALEFIGFEDFSVRTLELANHIVTQVDRENVGIVVDTYHFYIGESTLASVKQVDEENIFIFHINDAEKGIIKQDLTEDHRVFPGIGAMPLTEIGQAFKSIGYQKMMSLELFNKDYWEMDKYELGKEAYKHVRDAADFMFE